MYTITFLMYIKFFTKLYNINVYNNDNEDNNKNNIKSNNNKKYKHYYRKLIK